MKRLAWVNLLKQSRHWIGILCINNAFFIFLAWVAYPETFKLLVGTMIIFSIVSMLVGIQLILKKQKKQSKLFYNFLREPSAEHEMELLQAIGEIHKEKLNDLANELRQFHDELETMKLQSVEYKEFIESWVHEIKTPLSLVHFILQNRKEEMSLLVYQRLEHAKINIHDHIERILFYAKLQGAHVDYHLKKVSIQMCFEDVLLELQSLIDEQQITVQADIEDISVITDERSLQFILTQLLVNAVKYRNEEVDSFISVKTGYDRSNNHYYLEVSDNGIGVLQSDLPFIFDKGFTGDNRNRKQSTGIGLFLVKKLCDELQIDIEVASKSGNGFTIQLLFPNVYEN